MTIFSLLIFISFSAYATSYSSLIEDLPLTSSMQEIAEDFVSFEKPSGRIIQLTVITPESESEVLNFYRKSLPPLGWVKRGSSEFLREKDIMRIEISKKGENNYVSFTITSN